MSPIHVRCTCSNGYVWPPPEGHAWKMCLRCDGTGRVLVAGAPSFGCSIRLADRKPGEIVEVGNGDRGRILWHSPRKHPETTFLALFCEISDREIDKPIGYPSNTGVRSVSDPRWFDDVDDGRGHKNQDQSDPLQREQP